MDECYYEEFRVFVGYCFCQETNVSTTILENVIGNTEKASAKVTYNICLYTL
ncbi:hypothetical protein Mpsy_0681 [Methanolobus psychrophilus R15]|nr:hypothetical protein Mpsy_0681 [Methanolobus psychrophilus R15]